MNYTIKKVIIYGPTATGKTALAIKLAKKFNGELICADSRQVYKNLDIGTGKVSFESKVEKHEGYWIVDGVKIHGFDLVKPGQQFTVADFLKFTNSSMIQIIELNKLPIIVGGTGFYIKSLLDGLGTQGIPANHPLRKKLEKLNKTELLEYLIKINPSKAKSMNESDRQNPRRLIRAIEITTYPESTSEESEPTSEVNTSYHMESTSEVKSSRHLENTSEVKEAFVIGLTAPNASLYEKADLWLEKRLQKGMIGEVESLLKRKINPKWLEGLGLEYRWLTRYLTGQSEKDLAVERLKGDIHSFIRRQKTWFKQFQNIKIYDILKPDWQSRLEKQVELWLAEGAPL